MAPAPSPVVLDTSVVSILLRGDPAATYYNSVIAGMRPVISFQTVEEAWFGAVKNNWEASRRNGLSQHLAQYNVVWPTPEMVDTSANLRSAQERAGHKLNTADAWIAATALMLNCPLASHDGDFDGIAGLQLITRPEPDPLSGHLA